jgi:hypothetical protein
LHARTRIGSQLDLVVEVIIELLKVLLNYVKSVFYTTNFKHQRKKRKTFIGIRKQYACRQRIYNNIQGKG